MYIKGTQTSISDVFENEININFIKRWVYEQFHWLFWSRQKIFREHGALNISLIADTTAFIDLFLLYQSKKKSYDSISSVIKFLNDETKFYSIPYMTYGKAIKRISILK